jgi:hypothetical protein
VQREDESEDQYRFRVRKLRSRIFAWVLIIVVTILLSLLILSHPGTQATFYHPWLIKNWKKVAYAILLVIIPAFAFMPVIIEANFYPRSLSSPGAGHGAGLPPTHPLGG